VGCKCFGTGVAELLKEVDLCVYRSSAGSCHDLCLVTFRRDLSVVTPSHFFYIHSATLTRHAIFISTTTAAISWGLPLLNVWMFVVALLEKAVVNCRLTGDNSIPIAFLDKSVALCKLR
jgi:hypothetical protein